MSSDVMFARRIPGSKSKQLIRSRIDGHAYCVPHERPVRPASDSDVDWALRVLETRETSQWIGHTTADGGDVYAINMNRLARILIDSGIRATAIDVSFAVVSYRDDQRKLVDWVGCCAGTCHDGKLYKLGGETVCRRTNRPCPWSNDYLMAIAKLFDWQGVINLKDKKLCRPTTKTPIN